jgi:hypothetical protein
MIALYFLFVVFISQETIPYKPNDEFELKMDYAFRQRTIDHTKAVDFSEKPSRNTGPLPYLELDLRLLVLNANEERILINNNKGKVILNKKLKNDLLIKMDLGYTDDMKDRVTAYEYKILLLDADKLPASQILIHVAEDGTFLVNGEVRGKL